MRDLRDPGFVGEAYVKAREIGAPIEHAVLVPAPNYSSGKHISSDPADHHSKTPQNLGDLSDGGEA